MLLAVAAVLRAMRYLPLVDDVRAAESSARQLSNQARTLKPADLTGERVDRLRESLAQLDGDMVPLRGLVADDPLAGIASGLPVIGTQVKSAEALVNAADALVEAGDIGLGLAERVVVLREANEADPNMALMPGLVELMATSGAEVDRLGELVDTAEAELARIPDEALGQLREARDLVAEPLAEYGPLLDAYREYDDVLPGMLGWGEPRRYLVLAQNPAELRASGGYAGTVGIIELTDGAITEQRFRDVHELSRMPNLPFIEAPEELSVYLLGEEQSWRLADANWAADFPEAAQQSLEFYEIESGESDIDGVIAITTYALDRLLEVTGPIEVPQYDVTVAPGDVTLTLLGATRGSPKSIEGRKEVLDVLARRLTNRLLTLPPQRWIATAEALEDIGREQLALAWFVDPAEQALVDDADWDGRVRQDPGDYLYVVESNVSPTSKYNLVIDRTDSLVVKLDEDGDALNSLRLDWDNRAGGEGEPYASLRDFSNNEQGWYGGYLRVLVPEGSQLVTASGQASDEIRGPERLGSEAGRASFANYLFMPPGASTMTYLWTVPGAAVETDEGWVYELTLQKQPGARALPVTVRVDLPAGAVVTEVSEGATVEGERVRYEASLDRDLGLRVVYELGSATPD